MDDPVALGVMAIAIISAISTATVNVIVALRTSKKLDEASEEQGKIHKLVNSNLTEIKRQLAVALERADVAEAKVAQNDPANQSSLSY